MIDELPVGSGATVFGECLGEAGEYRFRTTRLTELIYLILPSTQVTLMSAAL